MTDQPEVCEHRAIETYCDPRGTPVAWACDNCRRRFYPACSECVSIGHRGECDHLSERVRRLEEALRDIAEMSPNWLEPDAVGESEKRKSVIARAALEPSR